MKHAYLIILILAFASCERPKDNTSPYKAFINATILDGTGSAPTPDGVLLIKDGRVIAVGSKADVNIPDQTETIDLAGKYIIPGLINAHGHVGDVKGIESGNYSRKNIIDNLALYARYGITSVVSLGGDGQEAVSLRSVNDSLVTGHARLFIAGAVITGKTPAEALAVIDSNDHMGVDFMKIRVDDNLGTAPKMSEEIYKEVIRHSHELGYKIATHMYYLDDAKRLLKAGSDLMAHSVRDVAVDEEFIALIKEKNVCYCPTLTRELSTYVYGDTAAFFSDPFFTREYDSITVQPLKDPARQEKIRNSTSAKTYRDHLPIAMANLKTLSDRGVPIVFGTDSGIPTRFMGYFEHLEMSMMADAGLTPAEILNSATKNAAQCMNLKDVGMLANGKWADFVVLDADPLADIQNVRKISAVYIGGAVVKR